MTEELTREFDKVSELWPLVLSLQLCQDSELDKSEGLIRRLRRYKRSDFSSLFEEIVGSSSEENQDEAEHIWTLICRKIEEEGEEKLLKNFSFKTYSMISCRNCRKKRMTGEKDNFVLNVPIDTSIEGLLMKRSKEARYKCRTCDKNALIKHIMTAPLYGVYQILGDHTIKPSFTFKSREFHLIGVTDSVSSYVVDVKKQWFKFDDEQTIKRVEVSDPLLTEPKILIYSQIPVRRIMDPRRKSFAPEGFTVEDEKRKRREEARIRARAGAGEERRLPTSPDEVADDLQFRMSNPAQDYERNKLLWSSGKGSVYTVSPTRGGGAQFVMKALKVKKTIDLREVENELTKLQGCRNPNVLKQYAVYFYESQVFNLVENSKGTLNNALFAGIQFTEEEIACIATDVLEGLDYFHCLDFVHRDIRAATMFLTPEGGVKLGGFGLDIQRFYGQEESMVDKGLYHKAPERLQKKRYDRSSDIWSLGISLIELAERYPPLRNMEPEKAEQLIPKRNPPKLSNEGQWSERFQRFLGKCLRKIASQRMSCRELMKHPFVTKYRGKTQKVLKRLARRVQKRYAEEGGLDVFLRKLSEREARKKVSDANELFSLKKKYRAIRLNVNFVHHKYANHVFKTFREDYKGVKIPAVPKARKRVRKSFVTRYRGEVLRRTKMERKVIQKRVKKVVQVGKDGKKRVVQRVVQIMRDRGDEEESSSSSEEESSSSEEESSSDEDESEGESSDEEEEEDVKEDKKKKEEKIPATPPPRPPTRSPVKPSKKKKEDEKKKKKEDEKKKKEEEKRKKEEEKKRKAEEVKKKKEDAKRKKEEDAKKKKEDEKKKKEEAKKKKEDEKKKKTEEQQVEKKKRRAPPVPQPSKEKEKKKEKDESEEEEKEEEKEKETPKKEEPEEKDEDDEEEEEEEEEEEKEFEEEKESEEESEEKESDESEEEDDGDGSDEEEEKKTKKKKGKSSKKSKKTSKKGKRRRPKSRRPAKSRRPPKSGKKQSKSLKDLEEFSPDGDKKKRELELKEKQKKLDDLLKKKTVILPGEN